MNNLFSDLVLNGGSNMINFDKLSDEVLQKAKNKDDIYNIIVNDMLGGIKKNDENNENLKMLMKITIDKYMKKHKFSKNAKIVKKPQLSLKISEIPIKKNNKKPNDLVNLMANMIYETL